MQNNKIPVRKIIRVKKLTQESVNRLLAAGYMVIFV